VSDDKQTDRDQEPEQEAVAQDLDLPDETAEQVKGGYEWIKVPKKANQKI
jgi:hypothetical protein